MLLFIAVLTSKFKIKTLFSKYLGIFFSDSLFNKDVRNMSHTSQCIGTITTLVSGTKEWKIF